MRTLKRSTNVIKKAYEGLGNYLSPSNFTYLWSLGSMALICLVIQILSGLFISMFYKSDINMAFSSVEYINRELYYGWLVRYIHMNGASIFFLVVYLHMSKHILYGSYTYPRQILWFSGMIIFILMMATAFMGYVLPWGQMSIWGATVITNIFSAIPIIGVDFVYWLWGGLSVDNATLSRFYSLHFLFPFLILAVSFIHLVFLHEFGSNNALGIIYRTDNIPFYLSYMIKDLYSWICLFFFFSFFCNVSCKLFWSSW
jgi:quinol-cytochrome oxidoreductase complex cytochrome b subunit